MWEAALSRISLLSLPSVETATSGQCSDVVALPKVQTAATEARRYADAVKSVQREEQERDKRRSNIKIRGLVKDQDMNEIDNVQHLVDELMPTDNVTVTEAKRLSRTGKVDVVVAKLTSEHERNELLRKSAALKNSYPGVYLSPDWTREQELTQYQLRVEKRRLNDEAKENNPDFKDWYVIRKGKPIQLSKIQRQGDNV